MNTGRTSPLGVNSEQEESSGQTTNEIGVQTLETCEGARSSIRGVHQQNRSSCSIHSRRSVVTVSAMSHRLCEIPKERQGHSRYHVEEGVRGNPINARTRQSTRRRGRRTTRHHNAAELSTARVGALRPMPHCLGIGSTRVGPGRTPTVYLC